MRLSKIILTIACLVFTFIISQELNLNNTYAVDDISITINQSNFDSSPYLCDSSNSCSSFRYLLIQGSNFSSSSPNYVAFYTEIMTSTGITQNMNYFYPYRQNTYLVSLDSPVYTFESIQIKPFSIGTSSDFIDNLGSDYSLTFTLSENNPFSSGGITPSGSLSITENGTYNVTNYAEAVVDVPTFSGGGGNYDQALENIRKAILIVPATILVVYFFYCIYRMIIKSTGGKP